MGENTSEAPAGAVGVAQPGAMSAAMTLLSNVATAIAAAALVGMVIVEGWQVFARYVLNDSPSWTEPLALLFMSTAMMMGAAVGVRRDAHFGFFIGVELAPPTIRRALLILARLVAITIGLMLTFWGGELLIDGWSVRMAGAPLPQGVSFLPLCAGGALIVIFSIERLLALPAAAPRG